MPRIPYQPFSTVTPEVSGRAFGERLDIAATPDQFGANVGAAMQHLGATLDKSGSELFSRAVALQQVYNQAAARDGATKVMHDSNEALGNYFSTEGRNAVDGQEAILAQLNNNQQSVRESLPNDETRRFFDQEISSWQRSTILRIGTHAGREHQNWVDSGLVAGVKAAQFNAQQDPTNDIAFNHGVASVNERIDERAGVKGWDPTRTAYEKATAISGMWAYRIDGMSKHDSIAAKKMYLDADAKGLLVGEDKNRVWSLVQQQLHTTGARVISRELTTGSSMYWGSKPVTHAQQDVAISHVEGSDYSTIGPENAKWGHPLGRWQVMSKLLPEKLKEAGMPSMTESEFLANHAAQDQLFHTIMDKNQEKYGSFNDAASMWFSGVPYKEAIAEGRHDINMSVRQYVAKANAALAQNTPLEDRIAAGREIATQQSPDDPLFGEFVEQRVATDYHLQRQVEFDDRMRNKNTLYGALLKGGPNGEAPSSLEELFHYSPDAEVAYSHLDSVSKLAFNKRIAENAKGDYVLTEAGLRREATLRSMANADPNAFLAVDVLAEKLPRRDRMTLFMLQQRVQREGAASPELMKAMQQLEPKLEKLNLTKSQDPDGYEEFRGALWDQMEVYQQVNKKPMPPDEIDKVYNRLISTVAKSGWLGSNLFNSMLYHISVPSGKMEEFRNDPRWKAYGVTPDDETIRRAYVAHEYMKYYGPKKDEKAKTPMLGEAPTTKSANAVMVPGAGPEVPMSNE